MDLVGAGDQYFNLTCSRSRKRKEKGKRTEVAVNKGKSNSYWAPFIVTIDSLPSLPALSVST